MVFAEIFPRKLFAIFSFLNIIGTYLYFSISEINGVCWCQLRNAAYSTSSCCFRVVLYFRKKKSNSSLRNVPEKIEKSENCNSELTKST